MKALSQVERKNRREVMGMRMRGIKSLTPSRAIRMRNSRMRSITCTYPTRHRFLLLLLSPHERLDFLHVDTCI